MTFSHAQIIVGDNRLTLAELPAGSVQTCVTSPPYYGLRDYGTAAWTGGDEQCGHIQDPSKTKQFGNPEFNANRPSREETKVKGYYFDSVCGDCGAVRQDNQIGLEESPEAYVAELVEVFRQVRRVLADDGTLWLNLGDSYAGSGKGRNADGSHLEGGKQGTNAGTVIGRLLKSNLSDGLKAKDLVGIPWRVAFALQADGWFLRSEIIWHKPNPMPESVTDRPTKSHEHIFLLAKSAKYFYDHEAIKEPTMTDVGSAQIRFGGNKYGDSDDSKFATKSGNVYEPSGTRNKRDVWTVATRPYSGAHFATYPPELIEPCILAGSREGDTVLDPFSGSGTTGMVAMRHGRNYIGLELNPEYADISEKRITDDCGMFGTVEVLK